VGAAHAVVVEAHLGHALRLEDVAAVEDEGTRQAVAHRRQVGAAELVPLGADQERIGAVEHIVHIVPVRDTVAKRPARRFDSLRVVARYIRPFLQQVLNDDVGGRLTRVVGTGLEGEAPHRDRPAVHVAPKVVGRLHGEAAALLVVHVEHGVENAEVVPFLPPFPRQRLYVLREAAAAEADAGVEEVRPDAVVLADAEPHLIHIRPHPLAHVRNLIHERDARGEERVGGVLDHLRRALIDDQDGVPLAHERLVEPLHDVGGLVAGGANHHAVRLHEVVHRSALAQELGIRDHVHLLFFFEPPLRHRPLDSIGRADGNGALVYDDAVARVVLGSDQVGHIPRSLHHVREIRRPVVAWRGGQRHEDDLRRLDGLRQVGGEVQPTLPAVPGEVVLQVRLVDGQLPIPELLYLLLVYVHTGHLIAHFGKASATHKPDVPGSDNCDVHTDAMPWCRIVSISAGPYAETHSGLDWRATE